MVKKKLIKDLHNFVGNIDFPISRVYLFGSQVYGKVTKHSDVDLIIVSKKFEKQRRLKRSVPLYLDWDFDYPVDFICLTPGEFFKKKKEIGVVQEAVRRGVRIA